MVNGLGAPAPNDAGQASETVSAIVPIDGAMLPVAEVASAAAYAVQSRAENTRINYVCDWKRFSEWCAPREIAPEQASPTVVATYAAWLSDQGAPRSTVERRVAGIAFRLRQIDPAEWVPGRPPIVVMTVLRGIRRSKPYKPRAQKPLVSEDLGRVLASMGDATIDVRDRALLLLGFTGAFRRSELVALRVSDVDFVAEGAKVHVRKGKTDQEGRGFWKAIPFADDHDVCPVRCLAAWLDLADLTGDDPLFPSIYNLDRPLFKQQVWTIVKQRTKAAGLEGGYGGHSLRSGFVTSASRQERSLESIMRQTGHRNIEQVMRYIHHENLFTDAASDGILDPAAKAFRTNPADGKPLVKVDREALRREREAREAAKVREAEEREAAQRAEEYGRGAAGQARKLAALGYSPAQIARALKKGLGLDVGEIDVRAWLRGQ